MTERHSLPDVSSKALRSHDGDELVDRIWQRLEQDLPAGAPRPRAALWWAPAAVVIVFGSGVFVGARWARPANPVTAALTAEPLAPGEPGRVARAPGGAVPEEPAAHDPISKHAREHIAAVHHSPGALLGAPDATGAAPTPLVATPPDWQRLANNGEWAAALAAIEQQGGFDAVLDRASAEQLMTLADIARFAKPVQIDRALSALRRVLDRFPGDANAPVAAYTLGNMLDKAGDRAGAAKAFAAYRSLSPQGDFAEDALAREVEVAVEQGDAPLARKLADQYAEDFPKGHRRAEIRAQLAKLAGDAGAVVAGDGGAPSTDEPADEPEDDESSGTAAPRSSAR